MNMRHVLVICWLLACRPAVAADYLFRNGKSDYSIVVAGDASATEQTAAHELQDYLWQAGGVRLPMRKAPVAGGRHIFVGYSKWVAARTHAPAPADADEAFTYVCLDRQLYIYGGRERGTMYGVYTFLERELGIHWLTSDCTVVPRLQRLALKPMRYADRPVFRTRLNFHYDALTHNDWVAHNRQNEQYLLADTPYGHLYSYWGMHTFEVLMPPDKYFRKHPEYYSLWQGRRSADAQLCLSNAAMRRELIRNLKETIASNPGYWCYDVSQNDKPGACECRLCRQLEQQYGGPSGAMIWFVNQVAAEIRKSYPDVYIGTFAYLYTRKAPAANIRAADNVVVRLCDIECCMAHPLETCLQNRDFIRDLRQWNKVARNIYIWDYATGFANYLLPFPNFRAMAANLRLFSRSNVIGMMVEGNHNAPWGEFSELKQWMTAQLLWNPRQDADSLASLFIAAYYGKAAPYVQQYYELCNKAVTPDLHFNIQLDWNSRLFDDPFLEKAAGLLNAAEKTAQGNAETKKRVQRIKAQLVYLKVRRQPARSAADGTLQELKRIIASDGTLIRENEYKLADLLRDLHYY